MDKFPVDGLHIVINKYAISFHNNEKSIGISAAHNHGFSIDENDNIIQEIAKPLGLATTDVIDALKVMKKYSPKKDE